MPYADACPNRSQQWRRCLNRYQQWRRRPNRYQVDGAPGFYNGGHRGPPAHPPHCLLRVQVRDQMGLGVRSSVFGCLPGTKCTGNAFDLAKKTKRKGVHRGFGTKCTEIVLCFALISGAVMISRWRSRRRPTTRSCRIRVSECRARVDIRVSLCQPRICVSSAHLRAIREYTHHTRIDFPPKCYSYVESNIRLLTCFFFWFFCTCTRSDAEAAA